MPRCCKCKKPANVLDDDGLTPFCYSCWKEYSSQSIVKESRE